MLFLCSSLITIIYGIRFTAVDHMPGYQFCGESEDSSKCIFSGDLSWGNGSSRKVENDTYNILIHIYTEGERERWVDREEGVVLFIAKDKTA